MIGEANQTHFQIKNIKKQNYSDKQNSGNSIENGKGRTIGSKFSSKYGFYPKKRSK